MSGLEAWLATTVAGSAITYGTLLQTTLVVGYAAQARRRAKDARRRALDSIQDRQIMVRTAIADRPIVLGSARLSGPFYPLGTSGADGELLHFIVPLAGPIDGLGTVYVGDEPVTAFDADGWCTNSKYRTSTTESERQLLTVTSAATITLAQTATTIYSVAQAAEPGAPGWMSVYNAGGVGVTLNEGSPGSDSDAYSTATVGGVTQITFHSSRIGQSFVVSYAYASVRSHFRCKFFDGQSGQVADSYLIAQLPDRWTSDHRGDGVSYLSCTLRYHPDLFPSGIPNISAIVRGERLYDTRTATTTYSKNPALMVRRLLLDEFGCDASEIDTTTLNAAANACDEAVNTDAGTTEARYTFDGPLSTSATPKEMLEAVLDAMMGYAVYSGGVWKVYAGVWRAPTLALDDDDFANDDIVVQARQSIRDLVNGARAKYCNDDYVMTDAPAWVSPAYVAEDNDEEAIIDLDLQYVRGIYRAQRIEKRTVLQARQALTVSASYKLGAYEITPGDVVSLTLTNYGISDKAFVCVDREYQPAGEPVRLVLREVAEGIDDWSFNEQITPDPAPNTTLPDVRTVTAPTLTYDSGAEFVTVLADGSQRPFLRLYWEAYDATVETIEVWWRRADQMGWQTARAPADARLYDLYGVAAGETWIVQARAINGVGVRSDWSVVVAEVNADAPANGASSTIGVGRNLVVNATLADSTDGWKVINRMSGIEYTTGSDRTSIGTTTWFGWAKASGTYDAYRPQPFNALVVDVNPAVGFNGVADFDIFAESGGIPVDSNTRIEVQCLAAAYYASVEMKVWWFDSTGAQLNAVTSPSRDTGYLSWNAIGANPYQGKLGLSSFQRLYGFVDAHPDAAFARVTFRVETAVTSPPGGAQKYGVVLMPYIGYARPRQTQPSEWGGGL